MQLDVQLAYFAPLGLQNTTHLKLEGLPDVTREGATTESSSRPSLMTGDKLVYLLVLAPPALVTSEATC